MSSTCDSLKISLLNEEERREEKDRLSSQIYELTTRIKDLKNDYEDYQSDGQYGEMEDLASEICSLEDEKVSAKERLLEFKETRVY